VANYEQLTRLFAPYPDWERFARCHAEWLFVLKEQREIELVLLDAAQRYQLFRQQYPSLEQKIAQYHIARYLGVTPTQLSRIRAKVFA
jgi:CRP-like cAMP-binding protein